MAKGGAQRAAELTGKSKSTIQRAMNNGKLSYEQDSNARRVIDVSELERVFGLKQATVTPVAASVEQELEKASSLIEMERMKMQIKMLEAQLDSAEDRVEDLKNQRDQWQKQATQVVLTSQYSQKQAEELADQLKERERRARERREQFEKQKLEERMKAIASQNANDSVQQPSDSSGGVFSGLWKRSKQN